MKRLVASLIFATMLVAPAVAEETLTVVSFGGDTKLREETAFYRPFEKETGVRIVSVDYNGGTAQIQAQVETGNVSWDVVNGEVALARKGCDEGLLEQTSDISLPPAADGTPAKEDYLPGSVVDCGVGMTTWSVAWGYQSALSDKPTSLADVFDTKKIPGKRGFYKSPMYVLEFALQADGVPPSDIWKVLSTEEGVDRAFHKLDTIKNDIVWWESWSQGAQLLADKEVAMGMSSSQRLLVATGQRKLPIGIMFNGQLAQMDVYMIPKGTKKLELAKKYIEFVSRPEIAKRLYIAEADFKGGPNDFRSKSLSARLSVLKSTNYDENDRQAVEPFISPSAEKGVVYDDGSFWSVHLDELQKRFNVWLNK